MSKRLLVSAVLCLLAARAAAQTRVAVLGDSISLRPGWPSRLAKKLGAGHEVRVFAARGMTVIRRVPLSVWTGSGRRHWAAYKPNVVVMMFGTNAGKPGLWRLKDRFVADYKALVALFAAMPTKPRIFLCLPAPLAKDARGVSADLVNNEVVPTVRTIAAETGSTVIDTHAALKDKPDLIGKDGLHPTDKGHDAIAAAVHAALTRPAPASRPATRPTGDGAILTPAYVADPKGDGPDGKGNTGDDTWQFWFALAHAPSTFHRLDVPTATLSPQRMRDGVPRKIRGPIGSFLPNPKDTHGWIYHSDWDGRFEGVWGDRKANQVIAYPYVEKNAHCAVAITYRPAEAGTYDISAKLTDIQVVPHRLHKGIVWRVEVVGDRGGKTSPKAHKLVGKGGPIGDKVGPESQAFSFRDVPLKKGELLRLVIDPNKWWGTDMTRIGAFTVTRVK